MTFLPSFSNQKGIWKGTILILTKYFMTFSEYINSIKTKRNEAEFFVDKYVSNSFYKAQNNSSLHKQFASLNIESMLGHLMNSTT